MCGICGSTADPNGRAVGAMTSALVHRGPDDGGVYIDADSPLALGARRLSIIDVEGGHQPLSNEDGSVWAVLNGEIYNHPELQAGLRRRGHRLATQTDTEVLVHLYEEHGEALVHALEGMYAFAIWDRRRGRLLLARDRFGEKPLFYAARGGELTFASELGALRGGLTGDPSPLDPLAVSAFLTLGYVPGELSMFQGVRQLEPARTLTWSRGSPRPQITRYWRMPDLEPTAPTPVGAAVEEVGAALEHSVRSRLVADVPVGVLLSGGLDSTLVAAYAARVSTRAVRTFTVGYDAGNMSETGQARRVADVLGTDHREVQLSTSDIGARVLAVMSRMDQPIADPALIALHAVAELAREDVTVAVGGEGADELFGGYPRYRWLAHSEALGKAVPVHARAGAARLLGRVPLAGRHRRLVDVVRPATIADRHLRWVTEGRWLAPQPFVGPSLSDTGPLFDAAEDVCAVLARSSATSAAGRFMALDRERWLPDDVLAKADRASMLVSLEMRTPFLDRTLAELAATVAPDTHTGGGGKRLLRALLGRVVPELRRAPSKTAFRVPTAEWLRGPLRGALIQALEGRACTDGWISQASFRRAIEEHVAGTADRSAVLWPALTLTLWLEAQ